MRLLAKIFKLAFTDTTRLVRVTPASVAIDHSWVRPEFNIGRVRSSSSLTARGSVALSRLPVVTEAERKARRERALAYDFSPND